MIVFVCVKVSRNMVRVRAKVALNMKVNPQNSDPNNLAFVLINHRFSNEKIYLPMYTFQSYDPKEQTDGETSAWYCQQRHALIVRLQILPDKVRRGWLCYTHSTRELFSTVKMPYTVMYNDSSVYPLSSQASSDGLARKM